MSLGIDLGISAVKAILLDAAGMVLAQSGAPLAISYPLSSEPALEDWCYPTLHMLLAA